MKAALAPGTAAPDVSLQCTPDQAVSLSDFRGQPVVIHDFAIATNHRM